jgi:hypothetical protein
MLQYFQGGVHIAAFLQNDYVMMIVVNLALQEVSLHILKAHIY